jgi:putative peptidoglycan lipid II flippase
MDRSDREIRPSAWQSRLRQIFGATLVLVITGILTRVMMLLTQVVIAQKFGLSASSDAYLATENIPEIFLDFVAVGFSMVFIPMFTQCRIVQGEDEAWKFASSFLLLSTSVSAVFAGIAVPGAPLVVSLMAPGFRGSTRQTAITLVRIMSLSIVFLGLDAGVRGLLQSHREFVIPELARMAYNSVLLVFAWTLSGRLGIFVLGWGIVSGAVLQMAIQFLGASKRGFLKLVWAFDLAGVKQAAKRLLPFLVAISGMKIVLLLDRAVASGLSEGSVAALTYAGRIILLPVGIFAIPLSTTLYPDLSTLAAQSQFRELAKTVLSGLRALLFIVIPACVGLAVLRIPLTRLFFQRGVFDHLATLATGEALAYYAGGVPAIAMIFVLNNVYLALGQVFALIKLNVLNWLTNLFLSLILSRYLGHYGIALGTSMSVTLTAILMIYFLKRHQLESLNVRSLFNSVCKINSGSAVMGFLLMLLLNLSKPVLVQALPYYQFLQVAVLILIGVSIYLIVGHWLKLDELMMLTMAFRKL